jgi:5-methylcytosine-specific restriction endonuclease McrA
MTEPTGWNGRGSTSAWRRFRNAILESNVIHNGGRCQLELPGCTGQATQVHHAQPWTGRPENIDPKDATPACKQCNTRAGWTPDTTDPQPRPWT